jgi:hypothetical protein
MYKVFEKVMEGEEPGSHGPGLPHGVSTRLLVCHSQAGSLIGK